MQFGYSMQPLKNLPALIISLLIIFAAFIYFSISITRISAPVGFDSFDANLIDTVKVYRDFYGIPHVIANNESDLFFAVGYIQAQDRLWQLDLARRTASGRLAEIFGPSKVKYDKFIRTLQLQKLAINLYDSIDSKSKLILERFSAGINFYIEENNHSLHFEFGALGYGPEPWKPTDCIIILRLLSFQQSKSFLSDIMYGEIVDKLGLRKTIGLIPDYPAKSPAVLDRFQSNKPSAGSKEMSFDPKYSQPDTLCSLEYLSLFKGLSSELSAISSHAYDISFGCNAWAIKKNKVDDSALAILCNDPHSKITLPTLWYQIHITSPELNVTGYTIPGLPLVMAGRNDNVAWGLAMMNADDCDFFIEKTDSSGKFYLAADGDSLKKFIYVQDTIYVKNEDRIIYYTRFAENSYVISDFHLFNDSNIPKTTDSALAAGTEFFDNYILTYKWAGHQFSDEIGALYEINNAVNWEHFIEAAAHWGSPAVNFIYSDILGNIGVAPAGILPQREKLCNPNLPNPSWMKDYGWSGFHQSSDLPDMLNPEKKYVFAANNKLFVKNKLSANIELSANSKLSGGTNYFISTLWDDPSRANRIDQLLAESEYYNIRDAQYMQMDVLSPFADDLVNVIMPVLEKYKDLYDETELKAIEALSKWDYIFSPASAGASIFCVYINHLMENTFKDDFGDKLYSRFIAGSDIPYRVLHENISNRRSKWFDDVATENKEKRDYIMVKSLKEAVRELSGLFDSEDIIYWRYGNIHRITLKHSFSDDVFLEPAVTIGEFEIKGHNTTISNSGLKLNSSYDAEVYSAMRMIIDLSDSVVYSSIPGGTSGDPMSDNYGDQVQLWLNGGYVKIPIAPHPGEEYNLRLVFVPAKKN